MYCERLCKLCAWGVAMPKLDPGRESEYKMTIQVLSTIYIYIMRNVSSCMIFIVWQWLAIRWMFARRFLTIGADNHLIISVLWVYWVVYETIRIPLWVISHPEYQWIRKNNLEFERPVNCIPSGTTVATDVGATILWNAVAVGFTIQTVSQLRLIWDGLRSNVIGVAPVRPRRRLRIVMAMRPAYRPCLNFEVVCVYAVSCLIPCFDTSRDRIQRSLPPAWPG
jgi:hypothetical protein